MHKLSLKPKQTCLSVLFLLSITILGMELPHKRLKRSGQEPSTEHCMLLATPHDPIIGKIAQDIKSVGKNGYIGIESPFILHSLIRHELIQAAQRGVRVTVFTGHDSFNKLKSAFAETTIKAVPLHNLHAKRIVIAGPQKIVWLGSMNMSEHSPQNYEIMVRCTGPNFFRQNFGSQQRLIESIIQPPRPIDFNSRQIQIINSSSPLAQTAKKRAIEEFAYCTHPHDYLYFVAYTLDDQEIEEALLKATRNSEKPITVLLDVKSWKNHRLRFEFLKPLVLAGAEVYIFNKDEAKKTTFGHNKLMHIKAILRKCNQQCLSLISTGNFTPKGKQEINYDLWEPCSLPFSQRFKTILDTIIRESTKLEPRDFPSEQDRRTKENQLAHLMKYANKLYANKNEIVRLIKDGANPNITDEYGVTPLIMAAEQEQEELVQELIDAGADVNQITSDHSTALQRAAISGNAQIVQMLIDAGALLDYADQFGNTPLFKAISTRHTEVAKLLIAAGTNVNLGGGYGTYGREKQFKGTRPPIIEAIKKGNPELVQALLTAGAQVDAQDPEGLTAFLYACQYRDIRSIKLLAQAQANVNIKNPRTGKTPLIDAVLRNNYELTRIILDVGADIDAKDDQGKTALYYAKKTLETARYERIIDELNKIIALLEDIQFIKEHPEAMELN